MGDSTIGRGLTRREFIGAGVGLGLAAGLPMATAQEAEARGGEPVRPWDVGGAEAGETIEGPDGMPYVWVPAGSFTMGSTEADLRAEEQFGTQAVWLRQETPAHEVSITHGFWLGKLEVTHASYRRFCEATARELPSGIDAGDDHPVVLVDWADVNAYCSHYGMRLPTEAEWEWAARGPAGLRYPWGQDWKWGPCRQCRCKWSGPDAATCSVGQYPASASWCGALDMIGNVWEWCSDWYSRDYYAVSPRQDPAGPPDGDTRATRGGSWRSTPENCRSMARVGADPLARLAYLGFRCAISPTAAREARPGV